MKKSILFSTLFLILFLVILFNLDLPFISTLDQKINLALIKFETPALVKLGETTSNIFSTTIILVLALILAGIHWFKKEKRDALFIALATLCSTGLVFIIKELIHRARPLNSLILETDFSFPSGHATLSLIFFGIITYLIIRKNNSKRIKILSILISIFLVSLICLSRLLLNVHYLTDILAGLFLGTSILFLSIAFRKRIEKIESKLID